MVLTNRQLEDVFIDIHQVGIYSRNLNFSLIQPERGYRDSEPCISSRLTILKQGLESSTRTEEYIAEFETQLKNTYRDLKERGLEPGKCPTVHHTTHPATPATLEAMASKIKTKDEYGFQE
jgi:hypothetical protein